MTPALSTKFRDVIMFHDTLVLGSDIHGKMVGIILECEGQIGLSVPRVCVWQHEVAE